VQRVLRKRSDAADVELVVTGMGRAAAEAAAAQWVSRVRAVVVCGLAGGLGGLALGGDVVVASRLIDGDGVELPGVAGMEVMGALQATVASVDVPLDDAAARAALLALGAAAVETEAAGWAAPCAAAGVPLVVVRAVLDTPARPLGMAVGLVRPGAKGPGLSELGRAAAQPASWPHLLRLGRGAAEAERRAAEVAVRAATALRPPD